VRLKDCADSPRASLFAPALPNCGSMAALRVGMPALPAALRAPARRRPAVASRCGASVRAGVRRAPAVPQTSVVEERVVAGTRVRGARSRGRASARQPVAAPRVSLSGAFGFWRRLAADACLARSAGRRHAGLQLRSRARGGPTWRPRWRAGGARAERHQRTPACALSRVAAANACAHRACAGAWLTPRPRERAAAAKSAAAARRERKKWAAKVAMPTVAPG
jgi:hypothetical protein